MKHFRDLSIRTKLFVSFGSMIILILIVSLTAFVSVSIIQENNNRIYQVDLSNMVDVMDVSRISALNRADVLSMLLEKNQSALESYRMGIAQRKSINDLGMEQLFSLNMNDPVLSRRVTALNSLREEFVNTRDNEQIPLIFTGKKEEATQIAMGIQKDRMSKIDSMDADMVNFTKQRVTDSIHQSDQLTTLMNMIILCLCIISLVVGFGLAFFITHSMGITLSEIAQKANMIAAGDLRIEIPFESREDEIGVLSNSFRLMLQSLRGLYSDLFEGINVLASSSSEILTTTTQITAGAAETASAVTETTTTIEEVKQTSDLSSEKARLVADNAQNASTVAQAGEKAVEEVINSMQRVQEQMEAIAENVVQLAEKSQEIGEIIVTVNDIAEQSNILAVNASIEAAMAGEEGKGFEVVAREIRLLADQSKQATAQVRSILTDIQRGVSAAVMASEQGNRTVSESMKKSNEAGASIRDLTRTISESAKAATLIAASSQQQTVGINQIVQSMENIKMASQQNLESTKQAETTAKSLHDLGQKLRQITNRYQL